MLSMEAEGPNRTEMKNWIEEKSHLYAPWGFLMNRKTHSQLRKRLFCTFFLTAVGALPEAIIWMFEGRVNSIITPFPSVRVLVEIWNCSYFALFQWVASLWRPKYWSCASNFPMNIQLISLGLIGLDSAVHKGLSTIFSNTTVRKHQLFMSAAFLMSSFSWLHTWLLENP